MVILLQFQPCAGNNGVGDAGAYVCRDLWARGPF